MTEIEKDGEKNHLRKRLNAAETNQQPPKRIKKIEKELHECEAQAAVLGSIVNGMARGNETKQTQNDHHNNDAEECNEDEDIEESSEHEDEDTKEPSEHEDEDNIEESSEHEDDSDKKVSKQLKRKTPIKFCFSIEG
jgi:hypothetical protein